MSRTARYTSLALALLAILLVPVLLLAQGDTTAVVHDKTGILGPVIDKGWPVLVAFLTSLAVKLAAKWNEAFAKSGALLKWVALYAFALAFNYGARWLGITELDALAPTLGLSLVQSVAAALVYRFGQHRVPAVEPAA